MGVVNRRSKPRPAPGYEDPLLSRFAKANCQYPRNVFRLNGYNHYDVLKAMTRYDRPPDVEVNIKRYYRMAADWFIEMYRPFLSGCSVRSEPEITKTGLLDLSKSNGYPICNLYQQKGQYIDSVHAYRMANYFDDLAYLPQSTVCSVIPKVQLQDEEDNSPSEFTWNGVTEPVHTKIRTIVSMGTDHIVAHLRLAADFNEKFLACALKRNSAYGVNLREGGAEALLQKMERSSPCCVELDGKRFDARFKWFHFQMIYKIRMAMFAGISDDDSERLYSLYYLLAHSPLVATSGDVFARSTGNPSGQACTTVDNTIKNELDLIVLYMLCTPPVYHTVEQFRHYVSAVIYGDDINIVIDPEIQEWFNPSSIKAHSIDIDMEYEFASMEFRYFRECSFLGHTFKQVHIPIVTAGASGVRMFLPFIGCDKMLSSLLFHYECRNNQDPSIEFRIIRLCSIRIETFACSHCREFYTAFRLFLMKTYPATLGKDSSWVCWLSDSVLFRHYSGLIPESSGTSTSAEGMISVTRYYLYRLHGQSEEGEISDQGCREESW